MRLSVKKATTDSVSRWLQKYVDTTNILQYPEEEFATFDFLVCGPYLKCIELTGFFSVFEVSPYRNYVEYSNKLNSIIRAFFDLFNNPNRLHVVLLVVELQRVEEAGPTFMESNQYQKYNAPLIQ